ncbi:alpha/beta hydrolase [Mucilaginibacter sp.]|uniref:alpha/beta hydrolase n=1 Tax=Mucilaginibacter sp. TaxID=1882438 RepID=UPI00262C0742|nr:alpha/beta hydrolase [Mucilaginibacter sp.]MDB4925622.1 alpha/beta hydrolase [Mucilaginibacter sp.]
MKFFCTILLLMAIATITYAQGTAPVIPLYTDGVPNSKPIPATYIEKNGDGHASAVSVPTLIPFFPEKGKATGTAVIICPGGGYSGLAIDKEGYAVAKEFNKIGITAFVLKYRLPSDLIMVDKTIGPLQDAQVAIMIIRKNAGAWGVDPAKVGIMGFSAGGHLASTVGTHFDKAVVDNKDNISVRPDFMLLLYPVISFGEFANKGSRNNLVGLIPTPEQIEFYSNEKQVTANTPPTFIVQAGDDKTVAVQNSLLFYEALLKNKVKAEMHLYQAGGHGFGLNNPTSKEHWLDWCISWMDTNGF